MQTTMICLQPPITCWHSGTVLHAGTVQKTGIATKHRAKECNPKLAQCKHWQGKMQSFFADWSEFFYSILIPNTCLDTG